MVGLKDERRILRVSLNGQRGEELARGIDPMSIAVDLLGNVYVSDVEANRDPDPSTNQTVVDGDGSPTQIVCQGPEAKGSVLTGLRVINAGAILRGGPVLRRVITSR